MKKVRVAVIGGGVSGIAAAEELSRNPKYEVTLIERNSRLGGLNQSIEIDDLVYDIGTFVYTADHCLLETFPELKKSFVPITYAPINVKEHGKQDLHPISLQGYWRNYGTVNLALSAMSLLFAKIKYRNYKTLPDYCKYSTRRTTAR